MSKMVNFGKFLKTKASGQTELPDSSLLRWQKLVENAKIQKFKYDSSDEF